MNLSPAHYHLQRAACRVKNLPDNEETRALQHLIRCLTSLLGELRSVAIELKILEIHNPPKEYEHYEK